MKNKILLILPIIAIIIIAICIGIKVGQQSKTEYKITKIENYKYLKYKEKENFGVIDRHGNIIIEANYKEVKIPNPEKDLFICYKENGETTVLDSQNEEILTNYTQVEPVKIKNLATTLCYEKQVLQYKQENKYGLIDYSGNKITEAEYDKIENLLSTEGKMVTTKNEKLGIINQDGKTIIENKYDKIETDGYYNEETKYAKSGFIVGNKTDEGYRYGYIDNTGKEKLNAEFSEIYRITEQDELYIIATKNGKYGLYKNGKEIIKPEYESIDYQENGALILGKNDKYGIANLDGKQLVETKYKEILQNGIYLYAKNEQENTVYDINGNKIDINFNKVLYQTENDKYLITIITNNGVNYYGIESNDGKQLVENDYKYIEYIFGNYFIVQKQDNKYGIIEHNGGTKIKANFDLIQKIKGKNIVQASNANKVSIYSKDLKEVVSMENARVINKNNYTIISNNKEKTYIDNDGNIIPENSDIITKEINSEVPNKINGYKTESISLEEIYYEKEINT